MGKDDRQMRMMDAPYLRLFAAGALVAAGSAACAPGGDAEDVDASAAAAEGTAQVALGPVDGHDLPPVDLERVLAGSPAPDFTALSSTGEPITLSDFRGEKDVILFFYRGHW